LATFKFLMLRIKNLRKRENTKTKDLER